MDNFLLLCGIGVFVAVLVVIAVLWLFFRGLGNSPRF